ncbi:MAG: hypothetical protein ACUVR8_11380 [Acidobacteriota bacterium]
MREAVRTKFFGRRFCVLLLVSLMLGYSAPVIGLLTAQDIPRGSVRWQYERALVLDAQGHTGRAVAALYRALDAAEEQRDALEVAIKSSLEEADRLALEELERTVRRRQAASPQPSQEQRELITTLDQLATRYLSADELSIWRTLNLQVAECRYLLARLYWRSERTADAIMTLVQMIDAPGIPEHSLARLLLIQAYEQLGAWEHAHPHLERLAALTDFHDPAARRALERLRRAATQSGNSSQQSIRTDLQTVVNAIEQAFLSSPAAYRTLTVGRQLHDPLAYLELAHLYEDDEPEEMRATLQEGIRARNNFFPVAWLALGAEAEQQAAELEAAGKTDAAQQAYRRAAEAFATAFRQLQQLDFQSGRDFDPERLTALRQKLATYGKKP